MKVKNLLAPGAGLLYPQGNTPGTYFCLRLSRPQKIQLMIIPITQTGNGTATSRLVVQALHQLRHPVLAIR